jgi:conjugal transfer pilus assembly protein TraV
MKPTLLLGLLITTAGCTTLGGNIKGSFSCRAPGGTCAPMGMIDRAAVSALGADATAIGTMGDERSFPAHMTLAGYPGSEPGRSADRVLKIVFPAHADATGIYREEAVAHVVIERGSWVQNVASRTPVPPAATLSGSLDDAIAAQAASTLPRGPRPATASGLAEAAAGLSAPPVRSLDPSESEMAAGAVMGAEIAIGSERAPGADALKRARQGYRIGSRNGPSSAPRATAGGQQTEIERTRALNLQSLRGDGAPTTAISFAKATKTKDATEAARRVHDMALPLLAVPKPSVAKLPARNLANAAEPETGQ